MSEPALLPGRRASSAFWRSALCVGVLILVPTLDILVPDDDVRYVGA